MGVMKGNTAKGQEIAKAQRAEDAPFFPAALWQPGMKLCVSVLSTHKSTNGPYICGELINGKETSRAWAKDASELWPDTALVIDLEGKDHSTVRIGNLAGITMARIAVLEDEKNKYFMVGDKVLLTCTGITPAEKQGQYCQRRKQATLF